MDVARKLVWAVGVIGGLGAAPVSAQNDAVPAESLAAVGAIHVSAIRIEGSSVFTPEELAAIAAPYTNRAVSIEELHELRHTLSSAYVERGYVSSGVVIPDQRVADGTVTLQVVEGTLTDIEIQGNRRWRDAALARRVERYVGTPVDVTELEVGLRALQEEPLVERVNAQLLPGAELGESHLRLAITERPAFELLVDAANDRSPTVGEHRGTLGVTYRGLVGNGDTLSGQFGVTEGVDDNLLSYRVPLNPAGTTLDILLTDQQADIIEEPFDEIDIVSDLESWSLTASHPFIRRPEASLLGILAFEHKRSESTLLGTPFSFSPGDVEGRARGSAVSLGAEWTRRGDGHAWALRGVLQVGVDALDATVHEVGPDTKFTAFLGQAQWVRSVGWRNSRLLVHGALQDAHDPLLAMYKMPVGGRYSVRGYRVNQFVRDNGAAASIEYQFPPFVDDTGRGRGHLNLAVFADYGVSWDEDDALLTTGKARIASAGLGLLWDPLPAFHAEIYWGEDFDDLDTPNDALQDKGFHYRFTFNRGF